MAILWSQHIGNTHYQVRKAGSSLRLYTNGVFHSQWNPRRPISGHVWDLLFLPLCFHPRGSAIEQALVLGVGGGALINMLHHFARAISVVGVDLDSVHLDIASKYFLNEVDNCRLVCECAQAFLSRDDVVTYDYIVEDLFVHELSGSAGMVDARKAIDVDDVWLGMLASRLKNDGVLVINFEDVAQLKRALGKKNLLALGFKSLFQLSQPRYENAVAVCTRKPSSAADFFQRWQKLRREYPGSQTRDFECKVEQLRL